MAAGAWKWLREHAIVIFVGFAIAYTLVPLIVIAVFSFNDPAGKFNFAWQGFTLEHWENAFGIPELTGPFAFASAIIASYCGSTA